MFSRRNFDENRHSRVCNVFFGMVVKTVKNGLSFAEKRGSKHNDGT